MGQPHMHLLVMQTKGVPCICTKGAKQRHLMRSPNQALENELIVFQASFSVYAIEYFCCAYCWVLDYIMIISSYYFWECDKLRMCILI